MNKVVLMGRLTRDPETRRSNSNDPIAISKFGIAVNRRTKREGEADADFINCTAFGKQGEFAERFLKKGMMVCISGRLSVNNYDDANGQKRTSTEVIVEEVDFAESKAAFEARTGSSGEPRQYNPAPAAPASKPQKAASSEPEGFYPIEEGIEDEDFPF